jgi:hypothetical protein
MERRGGDTRTRGGLAVEVAASRGYFFVDSNITVFFFIGIFL